MYVRIIDLILIIIIILRRHFEIWLIQFSVTLELLKVAIFVKIALCTPRRMSPRGEGCVKIDIYLKIK